MTFDDRLRAELRQATDSHPIDADAELRRVKSSDATSVSDRTDDAVVIPLVDEEVAPRRQHVRARRIVGVAAAIALIAGAVALPFALRDRPHDTARRNDAHRTAPHRKGNGQVPLINRAALQAVASALDATTSSGSFHVEYTLTELPATVPTTTTCHSVANPGLIYQNALKGPVTPATATVCDGGQVHNDTTTGNATVDTNPFAMKAVSNVSNFGPVTVRVDDTDYWETAGPDSVTTPAGPGQAISSFAGLVESTLGPREGAGAMMGLANPGGYLSITREAITGAKAIGAGTIDGKPVTNYRVVVDPALLAKVPGLSPEQVKSINDAVGVLQREGFTGNTTDVSVDANGLVVHTKSTNNFADGGSVVSDDTFSQFGCAGTVDIPGRPVGAAVCTTTSTPTTVAKASQP